ncbi:MAG: hypothetical protein WCV86_03695 [Patescibacteria group bacterium]|jgi:hypothetical protein
MSESISQEHVKRPTAFTITTTIAFSVLPLVFLLTGYASGVAVFAAFCYEALVLTLLQPVRFILARAPRKEPFVWLLGMSGFLGGAGVFANEFAPELIRAMVTTPTIVLGVSFLVQHTVELVMAVRRGELKDDGGNPTFRTLGYLWLLAMVVVVSVASGQFGLVVPAYSIVIVKMLADAWMLVARWQQAARA